jgi:hypothetical protein
MSLQNIGILKKSRWSIKMDIDSNQEMILNLKITHSTTPMLPSSLRKNSPLWKRGIRGLKDFTNHLAYIPHPSYPLSEYNFWYSSPNSSIRSIW